MNTNTENEALDQVLPEEVVKCAWKIISPPHYDHPLEQSIINNASGFMYVRKVNNLNQVYKFEISTRTWSCVKCGSKILSALVIHSLYTARNEAAPYCPKCEKKPNINGKPFHL